MTVEEMRRIKMKNGYTYAQLSEMSGVPAGTVQKIFSGETEHPRYSTLRALEQALRGTPDGIVFNDDKLFSYRNGYKKGPGEYTVEDYYALPDDVRVELIDGVFYDMAAPTFFHQKIAGEIYRQIANFIRENNGRCEAAISPLDVQLDCDDRTMLQPDVMIICDNKKITIKNVFGAPDFVLEVISPSTKKKDYCKKLTKYENAGVREYWILDPYKKQLVVFFFESDIYAQFYDLTEPVPINIYEGKLEIQFDDILKWCEDFLNALNE